MRVTPMTLAGLLLPPALVTYFLWAYRRLSSVICESLAGAGQAGVVNSS